MKKSHLLRAVRASDLLSALQHTQQRIDETEGGEHGF
jgi:hypothetical protein